MQDIPQTKDFRAYSNEELKPKRLDIFQHLKLSLRNEDQNCKCQNTECFYCIPCKQSICEKCGLDDHKKHILINKGRYTFTEGNINEMFKPAERFLSQEPWFTSTESVKKNWVANWNTIINEFQKKIEEYKKLKMQEIEKMFESFNQATENTVKSINHTKEEIIDYMSKNNEFFNLNNQGKTQWNRDKSNTLFLINYDILNLAHLHSYEIADTAKGWITNLKAYEIDELKSKDGILKDMDDWLFKNFRNEEVHERENTIILPKHKFQNFSKQLLDSKYDSVFQRIAKYNNQIHNFKRNIYNTISQNGNWKEIEKAISTYQNAKQKGIDNWFSQRKPNTVKSKSNLNGAINAIQVSNKEEICWNNKILEKYFTYWTIDVYGNNFKMVTKELQSSHADLMIKIDDQEEMDYGKVIEGTNEIMIYEKKTQKMIRKKLNWTKNPLGYTKFPVGCRSWLLGDKLYITGGKDEVKEYPNVIIYDRKTDTIKRIMDWRIPRAFHTMFLNEVFDTIMIIGGENNDTVEIFDPLTNRWQLLPDLLTPRANTTFYFDEPRGIMYALFGYEGKLPNNSYSTEIEYLDLTNVREGWFRLDYYNKTDVNLKSFLNVVPWNNEMILIYGGTTPRDNSKTVCVLNLTKGEITKVDKGLMEKLRMEAKKSKWWSTIVSSISWAGK